MSEPRSAADIFRQMRSGQPDQESQLGQSMAFGIRQNPDNYSDAVNVARRLGVRSQLVADPQVRSEMSQDHAVQSFDASSMVRFTPRLAEWASEPDNAAIAHDDLGVLASIEDSAKQLGMVLPRTFGVIPQAIGGLMMLGSKAAYGGDGTIGRDVYNYYRPLNESPEVAPTTMAGKGTHFVGGIAGTMLKAYLAAQTGGAAVPLLFGGEAAGLSAGNALESGATTRQAGVKALGSGAINAALGFIPGMRFGNEQALANAWINGGKASIAQELLKGAAVRAARGTILGTGVTLGENALDRMTYLPDKPLTEGWLENVAQFIGMEYAGYLTHAAKLVKDSRLKTRNPDAFEDVVSKQFKGTPAEVSLISADKLETFFQGLEAPEAKRITEKLGITNLPEALTAGTEVRIPTAKLVAHLSKEQLDTLTPDMRIPSETMTFRQKEEYQAKAPERVARLVEQTKADLTDEQFQAFAAIKAEVQKRLEATGRFTPAIAEDNATLLAKGLVNQSVREGLNPLAEFEKHGLNIIGPGGNGSPMRPPMSQVPEAFKDITGLRPSGEDFTIPTSELTADPARFQYKGRNETTGLDQVNKETGASGSLQGVNVWNPDSAGTISAWRDPSNGKVYVVNGHNRYDLAKRLGVDRLKVRFIEAKDAHEAKIAGAIQNIASGKGTSMDAGTLFRDGKYTLADLERLGIPTNKDVVVNGLALSRLSDAWFHAAKSDPEFERLAVETGKAGLSPEQQGVALQELNTVLKKKGAEDISSAFWRDMLDRIKGSRVTTNLEQGLFGEEESYQSTLEQQTDLIRFIRSKLRTEKTVGQVLTGGRYEEAVGKAATVDKEAAQGIKQDAGTTLGTFEAMKNLAGVGDVINEFAAKLQQARSAKEAEAIRQEALGAVKESIKEIQGKPKAPVEEGQTLFQPERKTPEQIKQEAHDLYWDPRTEERYQAELINRKGENLTLDGKLLNVDLARRLDPNYIEDPIGTTPHHHDEASEFIKRMFDKRMAMPVLDPKETVVFMAGGGGSGKGTLAGKFGLYRDAQTIVDGTLKTYKSSRKMIDTALDVKHHGENARRVDINLALRDVDKALNGTIFRGHKDEEELGRFVGVDVLSDAHDGSPKNILRLMDEYAQNPLVHFEVISNNGTLEDVFRVPGHESQLFLKKHLDTRPDVAKSAVEAYHRIREHGYEDFTGQRFPLSEEARNFLDKTLPSEGSTLDEGGAGGGGQLRGKGPETGSEGKGRQVGDTLYQSRRKNDPSQSYTHDLFGNPLGSDGQALSSSGGTDRGLSDASGRVDGSRPDPVFRDDTPKGIYATRTKAIQAGLRTVGVEKITGPEDAAQAFAYLGAGTVEHFDALVVDAQGKPLAVVGAFKGDHSSAPAPTQVIVQEASRVSGAAGIWFGHNHPSGSTELSSADLSLWDRIHNTMSGSGIEPKGLFAIGGESQAEKNWVFVDPEKNQMTGVTEPFKGRVGVPVLDRELENQGKLTSTVYSPRTAFDAAESVAGGKTGIMLFDAAQRVTGFIPVDPKRASELRGTEQMGDLWRGTSMANALSAIVVSDKPGSKWAWNVANFLNASGVRTSDILAKEGESWNSAMVSGQEPGKGMTFLQPGDARGSITFGPDNKVSISILEKADASTFVHELGHFWVKMLGDLAQRPEATEQVKADLQTILDARGKASASEFTTEDQEWLARAHEAYLREGKSPSMALQGPFARFKTWLSGIYRKLTDLNVNLTDDVRGVFDRIYASDAEIAAAKERLGGESPLFDTPEKAGMTPEQHAAYLEIRSRGEAKAASDLAGQLNRESQRDQLQWWKDELERVKGEVAAEIDAEPVQRAFRALTEVDAETGETIKLNKQSLVQQFGEGILKELPRHGAKWVYDAKGGGMDAEAAAEILGFRSGEELIQSLKDMKPRKARIQADSELIMKQRHGDMLTDGSIAEAAVNSLLNADREKALFTELETLRGLQAKAKAGKAEAKAVLDSVPPVQAFRDAAREMVEQTTVRDLEPYRYLVASRKAAREAFEAMAKDDYQTAGDAKQKELMNHHLYLEATKAKEDAADIAEYGRKGETPNFQMKLGKAGGDFLAQWNALASRYEFRKVTNLELDARAQTLAQWADENREDGALIDPAILQEGRAKNWREVPLSELRAVKDALKNIETVAKNQLGAILEGKRLDFENEAKELDRVARDNNSFKPTPRRGVSMGVVESKATALTGLNAYMQKMEWFIDKLDGGDINGPARRNIKKPIDDAGGRKKQMTENVKTGLFEVFKDMTAADRANERESIGVQFPGMDRPMNRLQAVSWLLNMGAEENRNVALMGEGLVSGDGTLRPEVNQLLGTPNNPGKFTASEARRVQGIWDVLHDLGMASNAKEQRVTGVGLKWKKLTPFTIYTSDGQAVEMKGGYYPLKADSDVTNVGRIQEVPLNQEGTFTRPSVSTSHTKEVTGATYRLLLDYPSVLGQHVPAVINNVTMGEAISYVSRFIMREDVASAIRESIGLAREKEFLPWLQSVADDGVSHSNSGPIMSWIMNRRLGMAIARLGGNLTSYLLQGGDSFKLIAAGESPEYLTKLLPQAMFDIARDPKTMIEEIRRLSPNEMRFREVNGNREVRDILNNKGLFEDRKQKVAEWFMTGFMVVDRLQTFPAWLAKYREGIAKHGSEEQAAMEADRLIARTFQAGEPRNLSRIMRGNEGMKILTSFQGDANTWYGILSRAFESKQVGLISMAVMALVAEQVVASVIRQGIPKKEDLGNWSLEQMLSAFLNPFGPFGDMGKYGLDKVTGRFATLNNPTMDAIGKMFSLPAELKRYSEDKQDAEGLAIATIDAVGMWNGIPLTGQLVKSWKYQHNIKHGKQPKPDSAASEVWRTLTGPPAKENQQ